MTKTEIGTEEAIDIIGRVSRRGDNGDEAIVRRGAELMSGDRKLGIEAFAQFAMHLDPESPHALEYHVYAHNQYTHEDWTIIGHLARKGTPLRGIGQSPKIREQVMQVRNGATIVPESHYQRFLDMFCPGQETEPSEQLKNAITKLKETTVL